MSFVTSWASCYLPFPLFGIVLFLSHLSASRSFFLSFMLPLSSILLSYLFSSLTPLSPLLALVPSQTNGAHYRLTKNSPGAKSIHFFFLSVFLSFFFSSAPIFSFFHASGGKWVTGRRLVSSFISWQSVCSSQYYQGWAAEALGLRAWDQAPGCLSVKVLAKWPWSLEDRVKMNKWTVFMGSCSHNGHCLLVRPGVLNLQAKLAADIVQREYITKWEWMRLTGGEKPQADA